MEVFPVILFFAGLVAYVVGGFWLVFIAFYSSFIRGVLCLVVPFYTFYFMISRWNYVEHSTKKAGRIYLIGVCLWVVGVILAAFL